VATDALRILGPAMLAQLGAAGAATLLGVWDRFDVVARAYAGGALTGLASFFAFVGPADELALAWGMCVGSVVTFLWMAVGVQRARLQRSPLAQRSATKVATDAGLLLGRTVVYFVFNALYLVTLAFTTERAAGDATVLSYSYLFASYLVAIASAAVGITRVPDMARGAKADWEAADVVYDTVPHGFRYAALVCAPAMAALVAGGADLVGEILPDSLPPGDVDRMQAFAALLTIWLLAALVVNFLLPALFAIGRARLVNWLSLPMVAVHVGATALAAEIAGVDGIVGAMGVALWVYGAALLALGGGRLAGRVAREIAIDAVAFCALAAGAFAAGWGFASAVVDDSSLAHAIITLAVGGAIYVAGVWFAAPRQVAVLLGRPTGPAT
jgi:peptidoglycan biosynthesis protein MviN/MurJ (putative lipid II flippase)